MMKFKKGQIYKNEYTNIFIKYVNNEMVGFIEGFSPAAIHDMQEIPAENLEEHINECGYERESEEIERFATA